MPHHCEHSDHGCGTGRRHALPSVIVVGPSSVALDTGDADEFSFGKASGSACFRGLWPCWQGTVAVAS